MRGFGSTESEGEGVVVRGRGCGSTESEGTVQQTFTW